MQRAVKYMTLLHISFIVLLSIAGSVGGIAGAVIQPLAYAVPVFIGYYLSRRMRREREGARGVAECEPTLFGMTKNAFLVMLPVVMPTLMTVFALSWLTSLFLGIFNMTSPAVDDAPLLLMLIEHALIPAVLEEALFRYLPIKLLAPYSKRWCVILSSLYFALVHMNLFQIPYALVAGVVFIIVDLICESVLPSVILHFLNNAISVLWIKYSTNPSFALWYCIILAGFALLSLIPVYLRRKKYASEVKGVLSCGETMTEYYSPALFIVAMLILTVLNLF